MTAPSKMSVPPGRFLHRAPRPRRHPRFAQHNSPAAARVLAEHHKKHQSGLRDISCFRTPRSRGRRRLWVCDRHRLCRSRQGCSPFSGHRPGYFRFRRRRRRSKRRQAVRKFPISVGHRSALGDNRSHWQEKMASIQNQLPKFSAKRFSLSRMHQGYGKQITESKFEPVGFGSRSD